MIRAKATNKTNNKPIIMLGITQANVVRLKQGKPIYVTGESVNVPGINSIIIYYADTDHDLVQMLKDYNFLDKETKVNIEHHDPHLNPEKK